MQHYHLLPDMVVVVGRSSLVQGWAEILSIQEASPLYDFCIWTERIIQLLKVGKAVCLVSNYRDNKIGRASCRERV